MKSRLENTLHLFSTSISALFSSEEEKKLRWLGFLWLGLLYAGGAVLFIRFLNFGNIPFEFEDWAQVTAPRLSFLQVAIQQGSLPLHMADSSALRGFTDRYLSIPDLILSPQVVFLYFMDIGSFVLANTLILYSVGMAALLWLKRRFSLSLFTFTILFLLFNFNGHILSHLSIGHANWVGYFIFPWLVIQTLRLLDGKKDWGWVTQTSGLMFLLYLQGAFHQFVWWLIFFTLVAFITWKHNFFPLMKVAIFSLLLSMVRILPSTLEYQGYGNEFLGGYVNLTHVFESMLTWKAPWETLNLALPFTTLSGWEYDLFIGILGVLTILYFGIWKWLQNRKDTQSYFVLSIPILIMMMLSIGKWLGWLKNLPIPLLAGERVASRIISLPFVFLLVISSIYLQRWLNEKRLTTFEQVGMLLLSGILFQDLVFYILVWRVDNAAVNLPQIPIDLSSIVLANHPDPAYTNLLMIGAVLSALTLIFLVLQTFKEKKNNQREIRSS